jgi:TPP-dependent trihydroxycyclohexane-1,2-dione (THcHDO) dehydratase
VIVCRTDPHGALPDSGAFWDLGVTEVAQDDEASRVAEEHLRARAERQRYL